jgi:hypothetical protein
MARARVERWDTHEIELRASGRYGNPFTDVEVTATFTHAPSGRTLTVDGFHDGGSTWRVRFMPTETGEWRWETRSADRGLTGRTGVVTCARQKKKYLHGPLRPDGLHFRHVDGTRRYLISTRVSCHFAPSSVWDGVIRFAREHSLNRIFFMMGGMWGTMHQLYGGTKEKPDFTRYALEKFRKIDAFIDALRKGDIIAGPYFYYFNDGVQNGMSLEEDRAYVRYGMARFGAYCNVMPCLANQLESKYTGMGDFGTEYDPRSWDWANEMGRLMKEKAVFGVPVTVHNPLENSLATKPSFYTILRDWQFPWAEVMLRQMQVGAMGAVDDLRDDLPEQIRQGGLRGRDDTISWPNFYNPRAFAHQNRVLTELRRYKVPVINEEPGYEMKGLPGSPRGGGFAVRPRSWNFQNSESLLSTFWSGACAGAYPMWGHLETYTLGDPLAGMRNSVVPQYVRVLHDVMTRLPYWEMEPHNEAVSPFDCVIEGKPWRTNFCYAKPGHVYVVFSSYGHLGEMQLPRGRFSVTRINPRTGHRDALGTVKGGSCPFTLPFGEWVLLYQRA